MNRSIAIIGGGISGLAAAVRLNALNPGARIVIYEASDRAGGKILTEQIDGFVIDGGPDAFLGSKPGGVSLAREVGLEPELVGPVPENRGSFVMCRGRLVPLPEGLSGLVPGRIGPMLRTPLLSPLGKARMLADFVIPANHDERDESLAAFVTRRAGSEMYHRMVEPLLAGIYGGDGEQLSLAATFPQFRTAERTHGGWLKGAVATRKAATTGAPRRGFLGFDHGMARLVDGTVECLRERGVTIHYRSEVQALRRDPDTGRMEVVVNGAAESHDAAIVTVPAWAASPLLRDLAPDASAGLAAIEHGSTAITAIGFPASQLTRPLNGYGYVVPRAERRQVMAMTWVSSKWRHRAPEDQVLVRGFFGRFGIEQVLDNDDDELARILLQEMRDVLGLAVTPTVARTYRWTNGMPQYNMGHRQRVAAIESAVARVPGLELAGNYLHGVGIPDSVTAAYAAAERAHGTLR